MEKISRNFLNLNFSRMLHNNDIHVTCHSSIALLYIGGIFQKPLQLLVTFTQNISHIGVFANTVIESASETQTIFMSIVLPFTPIIFTFYTFTRTLTHTHHGYPLPLFSPVIDSQNAFSVLTFQQKHKMHSYALYDCNDNDDSNCGATKTNRSTF